MVAAVRASIASIRLERGLQVFPNSDVTTSVRLSDVVGGLSRALDLTEGQAPGHAQRTVIIGMRIAALLGLSEADRATLFYALLLKDAGCTASASRTAAIFGADDISLRRDGKLVNFRETRETLSYVARTAGGGGAFRRFGNAIRVARAFRDGAPAIVAERCAQGADVVLALGLDSAAARVVACLEEHWDGGGLPNALQGEQIPLLARIGSLAQCIDVFNERRGREAARGMVRARRGVAFDPKLSDLVLGLGARDPLWEVPATNDLAAMVADLEPRDRLIEASDQQLDRVADAFALVIDAKSPWTHQHSAGVARVATDAAGILGMPADLRADFRRAALLHDVGKLAVSSQILDKLEPLTPDEFTQVKRHARIGEEVLAGIPHFSPWAPVAGAHHERLDGSGYPRGLAGPDLSPAARVLAVADVYDALTSERPYRAARDRDEALVVLESQLHTGFCPDAYEAIREATRE